MTQKEALDILKLGHNVYLTGPAGSGKTYLLNQYIKYLRENGIGVGITASTGIAATHMGGQTIHSWAGMGIHDDMPLKDITALTQRPYLKNRFLKTKVLIIDEVSMLHAHRLDLLDRICRIFRKSSQSFGGMQVIMCGDFFQLPPVTKKTNIEYRNPKPYFAEATAEQANLPTPNEAVTRGGVSNFEFRASNLMKDFIIHSRAWNEMHLRICYLDEQHRQDDRALLRVLNDIRNGDVSEMTVEYLSDRLNKDVHGYSKATRLFTHNADVDAINMKHFDQLSGETYEYIMNWGGNFSVTETLKKSCLAPETLVLKKGAQVMFVKNNYDAGYVNGTLGEVIDFDKERNPVVRTFKGSEIVVKHVSWEVKEDIGAGPKTVAAISQIPLRHAWAITVHKSQGMSLDAAEVDLSRSFLPGMGYVALSRVRSLSGLKLMGMNQMALQIHPDVAEMDKQFIEQSHEAGMYLRDLQDKKEKIQKDYLEYLKQ